MKKPKNFGIVLLYAFLVILAMPLLSAPAAPPLNHHKSNMAFFENGEEHTSQWLIRTVSESEEYNIRTAATSNNCIILYNCCVNYHSNAYHVRFVQIIEHKDIRIPKEHIYLSNSCFTI